MPLSENRLVIAAAGSGKTTLLAKEALADEGRRVAIVTYTNNNALAIRKKLRELGGVIPDRITVATWFHFLLGECARPYQRSVYEKCRIRGICFPKGRSARWARYTDTKRYYFRDGREIYADKIARFVIDCEDATRGLVTRRLLRVYDRILVDEFQDLAGYDLDLLATFMEAGIPLTMVGDPRQCTYSTNSATRNCQFRGMGVVELARRWEENGLCAIQHRSWSYRCSESICAFANALWPEAEPVVSHRKSGSAHNGIYQVSRDLLHTYVKTYRPQLLRYDRRTKTHGHEALNFGAAKGLEFDHVFILPHGPIRRYLQGGDVNEILGSREKFYVAITRAKSSVAFLYDGSTCHECTTWSPSDAES